LSVFKKLYDAGAMTAAALAEVERLLREPDRDAAVTPLPIRKQVTALTPDDLERFPIWEFTLDEEGEEGQDETTVRPRPDLERADPGEGMFVVRAEFVTADGTRFDGFASPHEEDHVGYTQPTIVTGAGQVNFWFGLFPPGPGVVEAAYRTLGKSPAELFPVRYRALVDHGGGDLVGELPARYDFPITIREAIGRAIFATKLGRIPLEWVGDQKSGCHSARVTELGQSEVLAHVCLFLREVSPATRLGLTVTRVTTSAYAASRPSWAKRSHAD
jgi:hypothetical protein